MKTDWIFKLTKRNSRSLNIFLFYVCFNQKKGAIDIMWLIPSEIITSLGVKVNGHYRIAASKNETSRDKRSRYKVNQIDLVKHVT